ncbi:hypothetical protein [Anaerobutyricum hallii]|uniref:hypothetical protein n=1 Tax=Anaerobutyricum hallii TaxID=39488 RepID=UPI00399FA3BD
MNTLLWKRWFGLMNSEEFDERFGSNVHIIDWSLHGQKRLRIFMSVMYSMLRTGMGD